MARVETWAAFRRRIQRESARKQKHFAAQAKHAAVMAELQRAEYEVSVYNNTIEFLQSMHKDCGDTWDWNEVLHRQAPPAPQPTRFHEEQVRALASQQIPPPPVPQPFRENLARLALQNYVPSFFEKIFGSDQRRVAELQQQIVEAQHHDAHAFSNAVAERARIIAYFEQELVAATQRDAQAYQAAYTEYSQQMSFHQSLQHVASGVLRGDLRAYQTVLENFSPFDELVESGMSVAVQVLRQDVAVLLCVVNDNSIMPREKKELTATGKLSSKALPQSNYWAIYQDYVCGCALRAGREMFALLPLPRVVVNVATASVDTSTGHDVYKTILAVNIPREVAEHLRYDLLDPSDSLANFIYRMKFKKTSGFEPVEPISADESFMNTTRRR